MESFSPSITIITGKKTMMQKQISMKNIRYVLIRFHAARANEIKQAPVCMDGPIGA